MKKPDKNLTVRSGHAPAWLLRRVRDYVRLHPETWNGRSRITDGWEARQWLRKILGGIAGRAIDHDGSSPATPETGDLRPYVTEPYPCNGLCEAIRNLAEKLNLQVRETQGGFHSDEIIRFELWPKSPEQHATETKCQSGCAEDDEIIAARDFSDWLSDHAIFSDGVYRILP
jgi:hypothetical protein